LKTTGEMIEQKVVVRQLTTANNWILVGVCASLDTAETDNELELQNEAAERKLHRMAKVHDYLGMWQGSQSLRATRPESHCQNQ